MIVKVATVRRGGRFRRGGRGPRLPVGRRIPTATRDSLAEEAALAGGPTPLEYMLRLMRDAGATARRRDDMAKAAAPFVHPRLAAVEHAGKEGAPVTFVMRLHGEP